MPFVDTDTLLATGYAFQDLLEAALPVWRLRHFHVDRVYYPPQEDLSGCPYTVACYIIIQ